MKLGKWHKPMMFLSILVAQLLLAEFANWIIDGQSVRQIEGIREAGRLADLLFRNSFIGVCTLFFAIACSLVVLRFDRFAGVLALLTSVAIYGSKLWVFIILAALSKFGSDWAWVDQNFNSKSPMITWGGICFTTALLVGVLLAENHFRPKASTSGPE